MIYRVDIEIVAPVMPTEDSQRVISAVETVFPSAEFEEGTGEVVATAHSLDRFVELLETQRIVETARTRLLDAIDGDSIVFTLKKQAALAGVVNFGLDAPDELGDIAVRIRVDQPDAKRLVESLTTSGTE